MNITVVIVTFKSNHLIENLIKSIPKEINILVVENSLSEELKNKLEKTFDNVKVYIPEENLGYAKAINYGVNNSSTNYVLCLVADVEIEKNVFQELSNFVTKFDEFAILSPIYKDLTIYKNYWPITNKEIKKEKVFNNIIFEVRDVDGAAFLVNKKKFKDNIMNENFFLYFENTDMCLNVKKDNQKIYIIENLKFTHLGTQSSDKKYDFEIKISRNWHYCWSKFYFYKKNYSFLFALKKISPNLYRSLIKMITSIIKFDRKGLLLSYAEFCGIFSSVIGNKASHRAKVD